LSSSISSPHRTRLSLLFCDCENDEASFLGYVGVSTTLSSILSSPLGSKKFDPFLCRCLLSISSPRGPGTESSTKQPPSRSPARPLASSRSWLRFSLDFVSSFLLSLAVAASDFRRRSSFSLIFRSLVAWTAASRSLQPLLRSTRARSICFFLSSFLSKIKLIFCSSGNSSRIPSLLAIKLRICVSRFAFSSL